MDLASVRKSKGLSQDAVARRAGIKRASYTNIECGNRRPSVMVAKKIAKSLGIDWTDFFQDSQGKDERTV